MNWLDIVVLILIGLGAFRGYQRGLLVETATLVGLVVGIWAGIKFNRTVAEWMGFEEQGHVLGFIVILLAVLATLHIAARIATKSMDTTGLGLPNKAAGALSGTLRAVFVLSALVNVLTTVKDKLPGRMANTLTDSALANTLAPLAPMVVPELADGKWMWAGLERLKGESKDILDEAH